MFSYLIVAKEVSSTGTHHLQGFLSLKKRTSFSKLKKLFVRYHIESRRGTFQQAVDYCKKDGDYIEVGVPPKQGNRTDLEAVAEKIKEGVTSTAIARDFTTTYIKYYRGIEQTILKLQTPFTAGNVRGVWIWGPPGTGKSHVARTYDADAYIKPQNKWWDGYNGQLTVILDDLDTPVLSHYLKIWADKWACTGETKGGTIHLRHTLFIVTSNLHPCELWPVEREDDTLVEAIVRRFRLFHKESLSTEIII